MPEIGGLPAGKAGFKKGIKITFSRSIFYFQSMQKLELIKQLESLIAFQADCLASGDWDSFDKAQDSIKKLEKAILESKEKTQITTA